jgi:hypothetical protein
MATKPPTPDEQADEFFTDPKHKDKADSFRAMVRRAMRDERPEGDGDGGSLFDPLNIFGPGKK